MTSCSSSSACPHRCSPPIADSDSDFGTTVGELLGVELPITGVLGDQQASLFGSAASSRARAK